jgi:N-acetylmuramoyl-L-alanine amidase
MMKDMLFKPNSRPTSLLQLQEAWGRLDLRSQVPVWTLLLFLTVACTPRTRQSEFPQTLPSSSPPLQPYQESVFLDDSKKKLKGDSIAIVIDAGHGGKDFGTHSLITPKYQEKFLTLSTAHMLKNYLQQLGYKVSMTRNEDVFVPLPKRASFANEQNTTLFVSVHYNSAPNKEAEGIEVYYYRSEENKERSKQSQLLAKSILDHVILATQARSRGVKHGNFAVIRETTMPAVLIEGGFLTNTNEMQKIKDAVYLKQLALGIAQGIQDYLEKEHDL